MALTEKALLSIINRDRAVIDLLAIRQGDKSVMELLAEAEDQVKLCRANDPIITEDDLLRMCLIVAFKDRNLAEKALAENYDLKTTIQVAVTRESSKSNAKAMQGKGGEADVKRVRMPSKTKEEEEGLSSDQSWIEREELEDLLSALKVRQHKKYSGRFKPQESRVRSSGSKCKNCDLPHQEGDCRAAGKECFQCGGFGHYARATACPKRTLGRGGEKRRGFSTSKRVQEEETTSSDSEGSGQVDMRRVVTGRTRPWKDKARDASSGEAGTGGGTTLSQVSGQTSNPSTNSVPCMADRRSRLDQTADRHWPGVRENAPESHLYKVSEKHEGRKRKNPNSRWISVQLQGSRVRVYVDTGCRYTVIPLEPFQGGDGGAGASQKGVEGLGCQGEPGREGNVPHHHHHREGCNEQKLGVRDGWSQTRAAPRRQGRGKAGHCGVQPRGQVAHKGGEG